MRQSEIGKGFSPNTYIRIPYALNPAGGAKVTRLVEVVPPFDERVTNIDVVDGGIQLQKSVEKTPAREEV